MLSLLSTQDIVVGPAKARKIWGLTCLPFLDSYNRP
jgi:hypothetical protein